MIERCFLQRRKWGLGVRRIVAIIAMIGVFSSACSATVLELEIGRCFDDPESLEHVEDIPVVGCEEPHDNEIIANLELTGSAYPGRDQVENRASKICYDTFADCVGISYEESIYDIGRLIPTEESWAVGDREVICFAYDIEFNKITGSINGIGR
jgi:hypothetical protein